MTESYAADVRADPCHIIVATPGTFASLAMGVASKRGGGLEVRPSVNLRHVRMFVCDEVDHLLLPATAPRLERLLQMLTNTPSHGSMHRLGRIVLVSAALSQRVHFIAQKWLNRPVTATAEGLLDGWVAENRMLKDKFHLKKSEPRTAASAQAAAGAAATAKDAEEAEEAAEEEGQEYIEGEEEEEAEDDLQPLPPPIASELSRSDAPRANLDEVTRSAYEEADLFGEQEDEEAEEREAMQELKRQDKLANKRSATTSSNEAESVETVEQEEEQQLEEEEEKILPNKVVRAEGFVLPGSKRETDSATAAIKRDAALIDQFLKTAPPAAAAASPFLSPLSSSSAATPSAASFSAPSPTISHAGFPSSFASSDPDDVVLPPASDAVVRFLPPSMLHLSVHVAPQVKQLVRADTPADERARALSSKVDLLARLHALLRPRVALVFFMRAADAIELASELRRRKRLRVEVLVSGGGLRAPDRLRAIESVLHGSVDMVLCTDLAARGLDLRGLSHVINFDLPPTALDYVHRAGRVERLGGKKGCTVVNVVRDWREQHRSEVAPVIEEGQPISFPLPKRKGTFAGVDVQLMRKLEGQLHLDVPSVTIKAGQFVPLQIQELGPHIKTPPTPKKIKPSSTTSDSNAQPAAAEAEPTAVASSSAV